MLLKFILTGFIISLSFVCIFVFNYTIRKNDNVFIENSTAVQAASIITEEESKFGFPVRLKIPVINVDSSFEYAGITENGEVGVPEDPDNVAWFGLGPRPGQKGSAVISGHYGWKNGIPAVFDDLQRLKVGDKIYVEDEKGLTISFVVREIRTFDLEENVADIFSLNDGKAHLNLITCEGTWNSLEKSYSHRLVVFTDMEQIE